VRRGEEKRALTVEELLEELEGLPYAGRVRTMIALGRRQDAESRALLAGGTPAPGAAPSG
jgi:hypothetical protein